MQEQDAIRFAKGFGYKTPDVDRRIDKFVAEKEEFMTQIENLKKEIKTLQQAKTEAEAKNAQLKQDYDQLKSAEITRVDEFSSLMEGGKKIVQQMVEDAKQDAAILIYDAQKVLDESKAEAESIKNRSVQDVKNISSLLAEIAKASARSKEQVISLYAQIDSHYQGFIQQMQKNAAEIFPKEKE